jgi:hypothetical protein
LVNTSADGARRSLGAVCRRNPPFAGEEGCSDPRTGAPAEPGRVLGFWVDGAGEDEPEGDEGWEPPPPDGGEEGGGFGVTGVLGTGTGSGGSGTVGVGGSSGVVTGPTVRAGAGRVPGVNAAASAAPPTMATVSFRLMIRRGRIGVRAIPCPSIDPPPDSSWDEYS